MSGATFTGLVVSGRGRGRLLMDANVTRRMGLLLGLPVVAGTLNVRLQHPWAFPIAPEYLSSARIAPDWEERTGQAGYHWCRVVVAECYRGVVAKPEEPGYPVDLVEILAEVNLREAMGLGDGDPIEFSVAADR